MKNDLINRQEAIDAVCKACSMEGDYHKCDGYPETSTFCDELVALRAMPSAQQWILVSEQLPKDYGTYICTCFDGCANRVTFVKWQNKLKQWILNGSRSYWKVIAWMPLPEPWKGEENDK